MRHKYTYRYITILHPLVDIYRFDTCPMEQWRERAQSTSCGKGVLYSNPSVFFLIGYVLENKYFIKIDFIFYLENLC